MADWRVASILAMAFLSVYNIALKLFITDINAGREDWRAYIPAGFVIFFLLFGYFLLNAQNVKVGERTLQYHAVLLGLLGLLTLTSYIAYRDGPLTVVVPVMGLAMVGTSVLAVLFLKEELTGARVLGISLGALSILVLSFERDVQIFLSSVFP